MNAAVEAWIAQAREDFAVAQHAVSAGWYKAACFHAQQCGEKWLKALLILYGQSPSRSHDLDFLADLLEPYVQGIESIREAAIVLTEYAIDARYPSRLRIEHDEAIQAVHYAEQIQQWAASQKEFLD
ncbi:HEPN domain-containing protein [Sulfobacillus thermosulfidooxidans]|uniref:HEPN domain-containing protein n=1 Tax=Sulfobacillus thermosulfidooxidans TaxID=28034 RepID=UPI0006B56C23|nr:HEPN domain-containing protein [Sulfobacillus thermosulfidooxidans]